MKPIHTTVLSMIVTLLFVLFYKLGASNEREKPFPVGDSGLLVCTSDLKNCVPVEEIKRAPKVCGPRTGECW